MALVGQVEGELAFVAISRTGLLGNHTGGFVGMLSRFNVCSGGPGSKVVVEIHVM